MMKGARTERSGFTGMDGFEETEKWAFVSGCRRETWHDLKNDVSIMTHVASDLLETSKSDLGNARKRKRKKTRQLTGGLKLIHIYLSELCRLSFQHLTVKYPWQNLANAKMSNNDVTWRKHTNIAVNEEMKDEEKSSSSDGRRGEAHIFIPSLKYAHN